MTAPYMHNGAFATLPEVVGFYRRISGGARGANSQVSRDQIDQMARELNMRGRGQPDLLAFLRALDDPGFDRTVPERLPSRLTVGGRLATDRRR